MENARHSTARAVIIMLVYTVAGLAATYAIAGLVYVLVEKPVLRLR